MVAGDSEAKFAAKTSRLPTSVTGKFSPSIERKTTNEKRRKNPWPSAPVECSAQETQSVSTTSTDAARYHDSRCRTGTKERATLLASGAASTNARVGEGSEPSSRKRRRYDAEAMNT